MLTVIDQEYLRALLDLPDGMERLERWIHQLVDDKDTAEKIAAACVRDIAPLRRQRDDLRAALNHEVQVRRDQRIELQAEIDAAYGELDALRPINQRLRAHLREQCEHLQCRIADGDSMGASVWRIALEDAVRENRVLLGEETTDV